MARKRKKEGERRIGDKIRVLRHEGKDERAAVGEAEGMEREGRLRKGGKYVQKSRSRRRGRKVSRY